LRQQAGHIARELCGGFVDTVRVKKTHQDDGSEFISASYKSYSSDTGICDHIET